MELVAEPLVKGDSGLVNTGMLRYLWSKVALSEVNTPSRGEEGHSSLFCTEGQSGSEEEERFAKTFVRRGFNRVAKRKLLVLRVGETSVVLLLLSLGFSSP